jgi:thiosulfate/3-mercaptopyruvate sulfurtransferase
MHSTLISADELASHLNSADWIVCDCRHDLSSYEAGRRAYAESHIAGARFLQCQQFA